MVRFSYPNSNAQPLRDRRRDVQHVGRHDLVAVSLAEFRGSFRSMAAKAGTQGVSLRADQGVDYGKVVQVLAIMQAAGVQNIGVLTEPEDVNK